MSDAAARTVHGVTWVLIRDGYVLLERCEKKARVLGVGEWFVPGGKIEGDETEEQALRREIGEEWPDVQLSGWTPLPIVQGSPVPPGPRGLFLMRPFLITASGYHPDKSSEGVPLRWTPIAEALASPVLQVRMMVAAAMDARAATSAESLADGGLVRLREFILDTAAQLTDKLSNLALSHPQHGTHHGRAKQLLDALQKETHLLYAALEAARVDGMRVATAWNAYCDNATNSDGHTKDCGRYVVPGKCTCGFADVEDALEVIARRADLATAAMLAALPAGDAPANDPPRKGCAWCTKGYPRRGDVHPTNCSHCVKGTVNIKCCGLLTGDATR